MGWPWADVFGVDRNSEPLIRSRHLASRGAGPEVVALGQLFLGAKFALPPPRCSLRPRRRLNLVEMATTQDASDLRTGVQWRGAMVC